MKALIAAAAAAFLSVSVHAEDVTISQLERTKFCNAQAGKRALKGDARKTFMSNCLKGVPDSVQAIAPPVTPSSDAMTAARTAEQAAEAAAKDVATRSVTGTLGTLGTPGKR